MHTLQFHGGEGEQFTVEVVTVTGHEGLNELYEFTALVQVPRAEVEHLLHGGHEGAERAFLGVPVSFSMASADAGTTRHGVVTEALVAGTQFVADVERALFRLRISPRLWLLGQRRNTRIFQGVHVHQIVSAVLCEWGVAHRWVLHNKYPRRVYCTQFEETDLEFVYRLLAEEGIVSYFEHKGSFAPEAATAAGKPSFGWKEGLALAEGLGGATEKIGAAAGSGWTALAGTGVGALADAAGVFLEPAHDPEAPDLLAPGEGSAGPAVTDADVFVFVDDVGGYASGTGAEGNGKLVLARRSDAALTGSDDRVVTEFAVAGQVRTTQVEARDYDFRKPLLVLRAEREEDRANLPDLAPNPAEAYEHHGEYETPDVSAENAGLYLQQYRAEAYTSRGEALSPALVPGHVFQLVNESSLPVVEADYAVVRATHEALTPNDIPDVGSTSEALVRGCADAITTALAAPTRFSQQDVAAIIRRALTASTPAVLPYRCRFECVLASVPYRPARPDRRARRITETATVVGPAGQDIYTDRFGRIKIQFHWDREHGFTESSSCWVRVAQPWSGAGYGFQFIPRVGMEVVVSFVGGDPDRPVVIGSLYNGTHATPEPLPERMTRSAIRTQRSPGGGAFHEIAFEDAEGTERVLIHSAKDLEVTAQDSHTLTVGGVHQIAVRKSERHGVGGAQVSGVGGARVASVGGDDTTAVGGSRTARVEANEVRTVEANSLETVRGTRATIVRGDAVEVVDGARSTVVHGDVLFNVSAEDPDSERHAIGFVRGVAALNVGRGATIRVADPLVDDESMIQFAVGQSVVQLKRDSLMIDVPRLHVRARDEFLLVQGESMVSLFDGGVTVQGDPISVLTGSGAELKLEGPNSHLFGDSIALTPTSATAMQNAEEQAQHAPNVLLKFTHKDVGAENEPIRDTPYRLVAGHLVYEGQRTNAQGEIDVYVAESVRSVDVTLYVNQVDDYRDRYPEGPLHFTVHLLEEFPAWSALPGARARLSNLGYPPGDKLDDPMTSRGLGAAVADLQRALGEEVTGSVVGANQRIRDVYGS